MIRTDNTFASWTAPAPGKYFVTVVAYNRAIDPSDPVCSDGVVIDNTDPILGGIFLANSRFKTGIVKNTAGDVFYVDSHRYIHSLPNVGSACG